MQYTQEQGQEQEDQANQDSFRKHEDWELFKNMAIWGVGSMIALYWLYRLAEHLHHPTIAKFSFIACWLGGVVGIVALFIISLTLWHEFCQSFLAPIEFAIARRTSNRLWMVRAIGLFIMAVSGLTAANHAEMINIFCWYNAGIIIAAAMGISFGHAVFESADRIANKRAEMIEAAQEFFDFLHRLLPPCFHCPSTGCPDKPHGVLIIIGPHPLKRASDQAPTADETSAEEAAKPIDDAPAEETASEPPIEMVAADEPPAAPERNHAVAEAEDGETEALEELLPKLGVPAAATNDEAATATTPAPEQ